MEQLPLFVFGTLRRGERNHDRLDRRYERTIPALLRGFARIEPLMIARRPDAEVAGELFFLPADRYASILRDCDDLEGIPLGLLAGPCYRRLKVQVETAEGPVTAWAYVHPATSEE